LIGIEGTLLKALVVRYYWLLGLYRAEHNFFLGVLWFSIEWLFEGTHALIIRRMMKSSMSDIVFTVITFTLVCASNVSLVTFTILLLASALLTFAPFEVLILGHLVLKSLLVTLDDLDDGTASGVFMLFVVMTFAFDICDLFALASRPTCRVVPQTLTVQLQTLRILALATQALLVAFLLDSSEVVMLVHGL